MSVNVLLLYCTVSKVTKVATDHVVKFNIHDIYTQLFIHHSIHIIWNLFSFGLSVYSVILLADAFISLSLQPKRSNVCRRSLVEQQL